MKQSFQERGGGSQGCGPFLFHVTKTRYSVTLSRRYFCPKVLKKIKISAFLRANELPYQHIVYICIRNENKTTTTTKTTTTMLQQEFEERVKMPVQTWEFEAINVVYNNSDLDKDEFCKIWVSMNKTRVQQYKKQQAEIANINKMLEKARNLKEKLQAAFKKGYSTPCYRVLTDKQGKLLDELTNQSAFLFMSVLDASFELNKPIQKLERSLGLI